MLKTLYLNRKNKFILPRNTVGNEDTHDVNFVQWQHDVCLLSELINKTTEHKWLLFDDDFYRFSVYFFALVSAKKQIILPQNNQSDFLDSIADTFDVQCGQKNYQLFDRVKELKHHTKKHPNSISLSFDTNVCLDFYTSGSSAEPQRISKKLFQLINEVDTLSLHWPNIGSNGENTEQLTHLALISHQHVYGMLFKFLWPLISGRDIYCETQKYPEQLRAVIKPDRQYLLIASPAFLTRLSEDNLLIDCLHNIHSIYSSGGPLPITTSEQLLLQLKIETIEVFGSTETGGVAYKKTRDKECWHAFKGVDIKNDISSGINSSNNSDKDEQNLTVRSSHLIDNNWFVTSDKIKLINQRKFSLIGRADRVVKIEEKRVSLVNMEQRIIDSALIKQCHTLVLPGKRTQIAVVAVLTESGTLFLNEFGKAKLVKEIKQQLLNYFELVLVPRKWRFVDEMPYNSQSKLINSEIVSFFNKNEHHTKHN